MPHYNGIANLSQAMFAHAYDLAISSSALRLLALVRDWARREVASSRSSGGITLRVGTSPPKACSIDLFIAL